RADRLDEEVVAALAEMGCYRLWNGSESGSQRVLDFMQRKVVVEEVQQVTHLLQRHGIEAGMFIMLGYDGEGVADIEATVEHLKIANPDVFLTTVAYPIKGTAYYHAVEDRIIADGPWEARSDRDLNVAGRHSRRFYAFATRWMVSEVALNRARHKGGASLSQRLKWRLSSTLGRAGMHLTAHEIEGA
ncbi:MAG: B12-binding domain-containing radical SAM protein, partial [Anaerolineae bacterium]|nr:B12-binding domain-containing radical SAM protein [Anaerolineae bacterium]